MKDLMSPGTSWDVSYWSGFLQDAEELEVIAQEVVDYKDLWDGRRISRFSRHTKKDMFEIH